MDSQHRHELEQNDLADALSNFGKFWERWGNAVLVVVLAAAVSFTVYRYLNVRAEQAHETAWGDLAFESDPQGLQAVARTHRDPAVKAMAYLRAGDLTLAKSLAPQQPEATPAPAEGTPAPAPAAPADPAVLFDDAASMYDQAVSLAPNPVIKANALLGRASVAESKREFDAARGYYDDVLALVGESQPMLAAIARRRVENLDELRTPVRFAPPAPAAVASTPEGAAVTPSPENASAVEPAGGTSSAPEQAAPAPTQESAAPAGDAVPPTTPDAGVAPQ